MDGPQKLNCELTLRGGRVVYDLNGLTRESWDKVAPGTHFGDQRWDGFATAPRPAGKQ